MRLFNDVEYISNPSKDTNVVFACDDIYFQTYGIHNISSCVNSGLIPHCHIINPSEFSKEKILKNNKVSFSFENIKIEDEYKLKTYYYCARFFIARDLFNKFNVKELWISDADVLFNKKPMIPKNKFLGLSYNADQISLWKQTQASLIYIHQSKKDFLSKVIDTYLEKFSSTDFTVLDTLVGKYERGNILGLDQVCMTIVFNKFYQNDPEFINLHSIPNLKSKNRDESAVTILIGKNKLKHIQSL